MKELIKKILREEYSPAGKEITPNSIVVHKSNPMFRDNIISEGLKAKAGECYKIYVGYGTKCKPAIFATNSTNKRAWFDSTYDDDIWFIDTRMIPDVKWYKDRHFESRSKHIVTFQDIPKEAITLKHEGTGKSDEFVVESRIKNHPKEEEYKKYKNILDSIVYQVVSKDEICGYGAEYFLNGGEEAVRIILHYKDGKYPGYEMHKVYAENIKSMVENYLPIVSMAFVPFDSTACKKRITENVDEIEKNLKVINIILNKISWEGLCEIWVKYNEDDNEYEIRSKSTKRHFNSDEIIRELDYIDNTLRSMGLRTYIFTPWYVDSCEDEIEFLNESKQNSKKDLLLKVLNNLILPQYEHIICGFELKNVDDESLNSVINYPGVIVKMIGGYGTKMWPQTQAVQKMYHDLLDDIWDTVWDYTGIALELYSNYVKECDSENINESEDDKEKKIQKNLRAIRKLLDTIDVEGLCKIWVEYNPEDGDYEIRSKTTIRYYDMADMNQELGYIEDTIRSWGLRTYVFFPRYVENCEDEIEFLYESKQERKFTKLLNNIEEYLNSNSYNSVVRFMVDYDEVMDDVIVNIFFDAEHAIKLGGGLNSVIKKTGQKLMEDLIIFPFNFQYHIHFEKPKLK